MKPINIREAKTHFSRLVERVQAMFGVVSSRTPTRKED